LDGIIEYEENCMKNTTKIYTIKFLFFICLTFMFTMAACNNEIDIPRKDNPDVTWPAANTAYEGMTLADVGFSGQSTNTEGDFSWTNPSESVGAVGTRAFNMTFTPVNTARFNTLYNNISVTVEPLDEKITPVITSWPAPGTAYEGMILADVSFTGGLALAPGNETPVLGLFAWVNPDELAGNAGTNTFAMIFTPYNTEVYNTVSKDNISVNVLAKENPIITWPADLVAYSGQLLSGFSFSGGEANVAGAFSWTNPAEIIGDEGTSTHNMTFIPAEELQYRYNNVSRDITVTVVPGIDIGLGTWPAGVQEDFDSKITANNTVILYGERTGGGTLSLLIPTEKTAVWIADLTSTTEEGQWAAAVDVNNNAAYLGTLHIQAGSIKTGAGYYPERFIIIRRGNSTISGGKIISTSDKTNHWAIVMEGTSACSLNIRGGEIEATGGGRAVQNNTVATVNIYNGTIKGSSTALNYVTTVFNNGAGTVNVYGGEVISTAGRAVSNQSGGTVNVSGGIINTTAGSTSSNTIHNEGAGFIYVRDGVINSAAGRGIYNNAGGIINISGGTVSAGGNAGTAIYNNAAGIVNISGGIVKTTTSYVVSNVGAGTINVTGGTVSTTNNRVFTISGTAPGRINISQAIPEVPTLITSANTIDQGATIFITDTNTSTADRLVISGGTIQNTAAHENAKAIYSTSAGSINISGANTKILATGNAGARAIIRGADTAGQVNIAGDVQAGNIANRGSSGWRN